MAKSFPKPHSLFEKRTGAPKLVPRKAAGGGA
jgi:hypothetical protein